jgi:hypothetical protein
MASTASDYKTTPWAATFWTTTLAVVVVVIIITFRWILDWSHRHLYTNNNTINGGLKFLHRGKLIYFCEPLIFYLCGQRWPPALHNLERTIASIDRSGAKEIISNFFAILWYHCTKVEITFWLHTEYLKISWRVGGKLIKFSIWHGVRKIVAISEKLRFSILNPYAAPRQYSTN